MPHVVRAGAALLAALAMSLLVPAAPAAAQTPAPRADALLQRALESRTKGDADAGVVVFEIADFQCPYCA